MAPSHFFAANQILCVKDTLYFDTSQLSFIPLFGRYGRNQDSGRSYTQKQEPYQNMILITGIGAACLLGSTCIYCCCRCCFF